MLYLKQNADLSSDQQHWDTVRSPGGKAFVCFEILFKLPDEHRRQIFLQTHHPLAHRVDLPRLKAFAGNQARLPVTYNAGLFVMIRSVCGDDETCAHRQIIFAHVPREIYRQPCHQRFTHVCAACVCTCTEVQSDVCTRTPSRRHYT